jgi:hypothetical protein
VRPGSAQVPYQLRVATAGLLQCVREHAKASRVEVALGELALLVGGAGELLHGAGLPGGVDGRGGAEGVAENIGQEADLLRGVGYFLYHDTMSGPRSVTRGGVPRDGLG